MNLQSVNCCDCEKYPNWCEFDDWRIDIEIVDVVDLTESPCYQSYLQPDNSCDFVLLVLEDSFVCDHSVSLESINKISNMIFYQWLIFISNDFLLLFLSHEMIDDFLHYCKFIFIIRIDTFYHLCHMNSFHSEIFILKLHRDKNILVQFYWYSYWSIDYWFIYWFI